MPQVSRKKLPKNVEEQIKKCFLEAVSEVKGNEAGLFINDLLTETERVMMPKRLAIAILLSKGWSDTMICNALCVTQSTVAAVGRTYSLSTGFKRVIARLKRNESWRSFWEDIEKILYRMSLPGRVFLEKEVVDRKLGHKQKRIL